MIGPSPAIGGGLIAAGSGGGGWDRFTDSHSAAAPPSSCYGMVSAATVKGGRGPGRGRGRGLSPALGLARCTIFWVCTIENVKDKVKFPI